MQIVSNWTDVKLADVCALRTESIEPERATGLPYVGLEHIDSGQPSLARCGSPTEVRSLKNRFYNGDILYGKLRPYLDKAVCAICDGICSTDILVFRPQPTALSSFLTHLVHTPAFVEHAVKTTKGVNHPRTSWHSLSAFEFRLPPIEEQGAIARTLDAVQKAKEARQRELALERERKAALMEYLFTHGTRGEPTKQTESGEIPESWNVVRLDTMVDVKGGKRLPKGVPFATKKTNLPYIRVVDFEDGSVRTSELKYLEPETQKVIARYIIRKEDVYISIAGTIGLVGTVPDLLDGANLTENAARLVIKNRQPLSNRFLASFLKSERGQSQISNLTAKTTQPKLALTRIEQIVLPLPSPEEQDRISDLLCACDTKVRALEKEKQHLEELFGALLEDLMTGRLSAVSLIEEHQPG
jgi:type I restriction enzyme, S subunit